MDSNPKNTPRTAEEQRKFDTLTAMKMEALGVPRICYDGHVDFKENKKGYVPRKVEMAGEQAAEVFSWDASSSSKRGDPFYTLGCGTNLRKIPLEEKFPFPDPLPEICQTFQGIARSSTSKPSRKYALKDEKFPFPEPLSEIYHTFEGLSRSSTSKPSPKYALKTLLDLNPGKDPKAEGKKPLGEDEGYVKVEMDEDEGYEMVEMDEAEIAGWEKV